MPLVPSTKPFRVVGCLLVATGVALPMFNADIRGALLSQATLLIGAAIGHMLEAQRAADAGLSTGGVAPATQTPTVGNP